MLLTISQTSLRAQQLHEPCPSSRKIVSLSFPPHDEPARIHGDRDRADDAQQPQRPRHRLPPGLLLYEAGPQRSDDRARGPGRVEHAVRLRVGARGPEDVGALALFGFDY